MYVYLCLHASLSLHLCQCVSVSALCLCVCQFIDINAALFLHVCAAVFMCLYVCVNVYLHLCCVCAFICPDSSSYIWNYMNVPLSLFAGDCHLWFLRHGLRGPWKLQRPKGSHSVRPHLLPPQHGRSRHSSESGDCPSWPPDRPLHNSDK